MCRKRKGHTEFGILLKLHVSCLSNSNHIFPESKIAPLVLSGKYIPHVKQASMSVFIS